MATIGSVKKPGTYQKVKVISGVVGRGGGIFQTDKLGNPVSVSYEVPYNPGSQTQSSQSTTAVVPVNTVSRTPESNKILNILRELNQRRLGKLRTDVLRGGSDYPIEFVNPRFKDVLGIRKPNLNQIKISERFIRGGTGALLSTGQGFIDMSPVVLKSKKLTLKNLSPKNSINIVTPKYQTSSLIGLANFIKINDLKPSDVLGFKRKIGDTNIINPNKETLKVFKTNIEKSGKEFGYLLKRSSTEAVGIIAGEIISFAGSSKAINQLEKLSEKSLTKLSTKYIGEAKPGDELKFKSVSGKDVKLKIRGYGFPKESFVKQVSRAGKELDAISSQANKLLNIIQDTKQVRKPLKNEEKLSNQIKAQLSKFDEGKLNPKQILELNKKVNLLERSFFAQAEERGVLDTRLSRLGIKETKPATLKDLYYGEDITFRKNKPQFLYFEKQKIARFPNKIQKGIDKILKSKISEKQKELNLYKYLDKNRDVIRLFQLKETNQFKTLGKISRESEITLNPKATIKRLKTVGVTLAKNRRVPIVQSIIQKPTEIRIVARELLKNINKLEKNIKLVSRGRFPKRMIPIGERRVIKDLINNLRSEKRVSDFYYKNIQKDFRNPTIKRYIKSMPKIDQKNLRLLESRFNSYSKKLRRYLNIKPSILYAVSNSSNINNILSKPIKTIKSLKKGIEYKSTSKTSTSRGSSYKPASRSYATSGSKTSGYKSTYGGSTTPGSKTPRSPYKPTPPYYPGKVPPKTPPKTLVPGSPYFTESKKVNLKAGSKNGFLIYEKRGKKFYKLGSLPLTFSDAKDKLAYRVDNKLSRTMRLVEIRGVKNLGKLNSGEKGYFEKTKKQLREYKIRKGKGFKTPNQFIEKMKYSLNKPGERKQLNLNKRLKRK